MGGHTWKKVDINGNRWKAEYSVMFFIYISLFTVSLANRDRPKLLSINPPLVFVTGPPRLQNLRVSVPIPYPGTRLTKKLSHTKP